MSDRKILLLPDLPERITYRFPEDVPAFEEVKGDLIELELQAERHDGGWVTLIYSGKARFGTFELYRAGGFGYTEEAAIEEMKVFLEEGC